jgi:drug/metabolite transporter (DMT)-like permease
MELRIVIVWWLVCLLWSSTFLFIKLGLQELPPFTFAWVRLAIALVVLGPVAIVQTRRHPLSRRQLVDIFAAGVLLLGVNYALIFWGTQFVPSGLVAILQSATPVLALAFGAFLGSEKVTNRKLLAVGAGMLGVAIIFGAEARASGREALLGSAAVFGGSACVAFAYVWIKTYGQQVSRTSITALQSVAGLLPLVCLGFAIEGAPAFTEWSPTAWISLLYLALIASVVAFWLNYWLLSRMDASAMLMMGVAEVPIAVLLGALVFGERLPHGTLLGAACVLIGVVAALRGKPVTASTVAG